MCGSKECNQWSIFNDLRPAPETRRKERTHFIHGGLIEFHHHLADVVSGEEADECTLGLVKAFDNGFFAFQFLRLQIAAHFLLKFTAPSQRITHDHAAHRQPFGGDVK